MVIRYPNARHKNKLLKANAEKETCYIQRERDKDDGRFLAVNSASTKLVIFKTRQTRNHTQRILHLTEIFFKNDEEKDIFRNAKKA